MSRSEQEQTLVIRTFDGLTHLPFRQYDELRRAAMSFGLKWHESDGVAFREFITGPCIVIKVKE